MEKWLLSRRVVLSSVKAKDTLDFCLPEKNARASDFHRVVGRTPGLNEILFTSCNSKYNFYCTVHVQLYTYTESGIHYTDLTGTKGQIDRAKRFHPVTSVVAAFDV